MSTISVFLRKVSEDRLQEYFAMRSLEVHEGIWQEKVTARVNAIQNMIEGLSEEHQALIIDDIDRIREMADEAGQVALLQLGLSPGREELSEWDLSTEVFCHDEDMFKRAEQVRFTDHYRRRRTWDGWSIPKTLALSERNEALSVLEASLRARVGGERSIQIDPFVRKRLDFEGNAHEIHQFTIYREGPVTIGLEFQGSSLERRHRRPAIEASVTYEPATGTLEVVGGQRDEREDLAKIFANDMLQGANLGDALQLRRYDLSVLMKPFDFPTDPEDGIESVSLQSLRLMPRDTTFERVTLERLVGSKGTLWDMAAERFGTRSPLGEDWVITKAALVVWTCHVLVPPQVLV